MYIAYRRNIRPVKDPCMPAPGKPAINRIQREDQIVDENRMEHRLFET